MKNNCVCVICGLKHYKPPYRLKNLKRGVTCSKECADKLQTTGRKRNPNYKCCECDKPCYQRPSDIKNLKHGLTCGNNECSQKLNSRIMKGKNNHQFGIKGSANASFKGGRRISSYGYIIIYCPLHSRKMFDGYVFEHILVMENHTGRSLKYYGHNHRHNEVCHHKDEDKQNNNIDNLELMTLEEHSRFHNKN